MTMNFTNPVYPEYFADPFCWRHEDTYYAVGTGRREGEMGATGDTAIPLIVSHDLQHWTPVGNALHVPPDEKCGKFWAPEAAFHDRMFYLYYHPNGSGKGFRIRVAVSAHPEGPYVDTGTPLTDVSQNPFAIDAHPFQDEDGAWYLFYATDFLDFDQHTFRGTALVVDKMRSMTELEGRPQVVMRAHWQWQCYERGRSKAGQVADWYTLEGPMVRKHAGRYYCFYSGGCFQDETYGVDYLVADHVLGPWRETGGARGPQLMRTVPGEVRGPGHHSLVSSPNGKEDFAVYHAWNPSMTARLMWIDPLLWTPQGPVIERFQQSIRHTTQQEKREEKR